MGSHNSEKPQDFYSSPYLAEHYDLICAHEGAFFKDIETFLVELMQIREIKRARGQDPDAIVVVDVGTGTGRALHSLAQRAHQSDIDLSKATFIGFDLSQDMVDRASHTRDLTGVGGVAWKCASAVDLDKVLAARGLQGCVDMLMFADGGFLHLEEPDEARQFLQAVETSLRPGVGRACLSITNRDSVEDIHYYDPSSDSVPEYESQKYPGLIYRNKFMEITEQGAVGISTFQFEVLRVHGDGRRELVESHLTQLRGRWWTNSEMKDLIRDVPGLQIAQIASPDHRQQFFIVTRVD